MTRAPPTRSPTLEGDPITARELDYMAFVEACYRIDLPEQEWLRGIATAATPLMDFGGGIHAYLVDLGQPQPLTNPVLVGGSDGWQRDWHEHWWLNFMARMSPEHVSQLHTLSPVNFTSDLWATAQAAIPAFGDYLPDAVVRRYSNARPRLRAGLGREPVAREPSGFRYPDSFNVAALDATGRGAVLIANMHELAGGAVPPSDVALWGRLGVHIAAGHRLIRSRRVNEGELAGVDAVLEPSGRLAHVAEDHRDSLALAALRARVVAVDRARAEQRHDWRATTGAWQGLTDGRWSLIDRFDRDGRRYYLARANVPDATHQELTPREAQVARAAALGHSNKLIGYELGIAASTVATHLKSAAHKLGVSSRVELIRRLRVDDRD